MPSAASSGSSRNRGGLARPDTAPSSSKRSVRFSDELGLDDELFGNERPSTAPGERSGRRQQRKEEKDDTNTGSLLEDDKKPLTGSKQTRRQAKINGGCTMSECRLVLLFLHYFTLLRFNAL